MITGDAPLNSIRRGATVTADGPQSLTLSARLSDLDHPATFAERLPKALIHHNVPGHPVYDQGRASLWLPACAGYD